ncbi:N-acetylglucosamine kinase [Arthrobacter psychrochitiniphilus]|uniref:N-acetylglucosamine kinase n=1 Tax=Arthrobacter psychrochitiniphilus TaxID=291045 RepID=UPI003F7CBDA1
MSAATLALDVGQTGTKVRLTSSEGIQEMLLPGVRTHEPVVPQLAMFANRVATETNLVFNTVAMGVSGITKGEQDAAPLLALIESRSVRRVLLTHDSVTSYLGALGERRGAVVASGTGVVTLGVGRTAVARVDGWGNIMGDAGSGHWIGREALDAVMRAHDRRGPATALTAVVQERWPDVEEAYIALQSSPERVRIVAGFARSVVLLAEGDPVAHGICVAAAQELAHSVRTALHRVSDPQARGETLSVSVLGGVFSSTLISETFARYLEEQCPSVVLEVARGTGLDGVTLLPSLPSHHPLLSLVSSSER